jgi:hypothetical protein
VDRWVYDKLLPKSSLDLSGAVDGASPICGRVNRYHLEGVMRSWVVFGVVGTVACGSSLDVGGGGGEGGGGALDGTWDIISAGEGAQMTVSGATITGFVPQGAESKNYYATQYPDCMITKGRTEFSFAVEGNALTGTRNKVLQLSGSTCPSVPPGYNTPYAVSGVRTRTAPDSTTPLNGDWQVTGQGEAWTGTVNGSTATATSSTARRVPADTISVSIAGNMITVTSSDALLSFAARKQ